MKEIGGILFSIRAQLIQIKEENKRLQAEKAELKVEDAAVVVQSWYRGIRIKNSYVDVRNASVLIQSWFRGMKVRKECKRKIYAVIMIQSFTRMLICRMDYLLQKDLSEEKGGANR